MWPAPSSKFLKMARGPKTLATPAIDQCHINKLLDINISTIIESVVQSLAVISNKPSIFFAIEVYETVIAA